MLMGDSTKNMTNLEKVELARDALWPNYAPPADIVFVRGVGSELIAENGDAYLDFLSGIAVTSFGHAHPYLVNILQQQAETLWHTSNLFRIPAAELLAKRLVENCFADKVFFSNSGTEAVEAGIKAIRGYQNSCGNEDRYRVIGFGESFHGRTLAALAVAGNELHTKSFIPLDYGFDNVEWENIDALRAAVTTNTAGIVLEPVQGEGGIRPITTEFLQAVRDLCDENDLLLMFDEVQCGLGRSGKLFAHQHFGVTPDIMALAKGLGSGFPVGACLTTEAVAQAMVVGAHGSTFGGNPLAMAVANGVMDLVLEPGLLDEVSRKSDIIKTGLINLITEHSDKLESVHGLGLMLGLKCKIPSADLLAKLRERKILVGTAGNNMLRLLPPLNISDTDIDRAINLIDDSLDEF
jgi:acetylornithine/N-succinyldiaminopimelate aminotransferase|tara:strand:- start:574 stop:1797 length:1224 start_codon:yes stop_codon:yes gene_type:complete